MPLKRNSKADFGCIWLNGPPNSGKTSSFATCTKPMGIISVPGEKGHACIPYGEGVEAFVWEDDGTPAKDRNTLYYQKVWREIENTTTDLINGKYGPIQTIVIDGMHKLYDIALAIATDTESAVPQSAFETTINDKGKEVLKGEFDPRCYGKSHKIIFQYVNMVASSKVPTRIFTSWSKMKKDDKKDTSKNAAEHLMPALPGEAAQMVLGEVGVTLHTKISVKGEFLWQTKPGGEVAGAGIKGPARIVEKVPMFIPQDFQVLAGYFKEAVSI